MATDPLIKDGDGTLKPDPPIPTAHLKSRMSEEPHTTMRHRDVVAYDEHGKRLKRWAWNDPAKPRRSTRSITIDGVIHLPVWS